MVAARRAAAFGVFGVDREGLFASGFFLVADHGWIVTMGGVQGVYYSGICSTYLGYSVV